MVKLSPRFSMSSSWLAIYSAIISSVMFPELTVKKPRHHRCWPQNAFLSAGNSESSLREVLPLRYWAILLTESWGGAEMKIWTWSREIWPLNISMLLVRHISLIKSLVLAPILPSSTGFLYFVDQIRLYFRSKV